MVSNNKNKIILKKFDKEFITKNYLGWLNDKNLMRYSENRHKKHTWVSCEKYIDDMIGSGNLLYAIIDRVSNLHVGNINAFIDTNNSVADIGILIGVPRKGYGGDAWIAMIQKLFLDKKIRKVTAGTMAINKAMIKIFINTGMEFEYSKKDHFMIENNLVDLIGYSIFNPNVNNYD
jgi:RimJ/RimL family protein N-acetyltransferase